MAVKVNQQSEGVTSFSTLTPDDKHPSNKNNAVPPTTEVFAPIMDDQFS